MTRRGGILLEVLLSLALFVGAASFAIVAMQQAADRLDRSRRQAFAADLAASIVAELQAGLRTVGDLRDLDAGLDSIGSVDVAAPRGPFEPALWEVTYETDPTEHPGLTRLAITVREIAPGEDEDGAVEATLVQLVRLGDDTEEGDPIDAMLEGLPEGDGP